mgnify:CR=1 FL=1
MNVHRVYVEGLSVMIEGDGPVAIFLHGWPDSPALWDGLVASLRERWTCVRFALPGFDLTRPPRPVSVDEMCRLIAAVVDVVSPGAPVTLVLHDWGCFFGYEYAARHVDRVARVVGVDIGDSNSGAYLKGLSAREKFLIAGYQLWLATTWNLGAWWPSLADRLTRFMARQVGGRADPAAIGWQMNYPYAMQWFGSHGGLRGVARVHKVFGPCIPILFCYGRRKPFMFHSQPWVESLGTLPGSAAHGFDAGHWLMRQKPAEFAQVVSGWLDRSREAA